MDPRNIAIADYTYELPETKIAAYPLPNRGESKLLIYKYGKIEESTYQNIANYLPDNSLLVFNNTKVIAARILFQKQTGGTIEIFCLEPYETIKDYSAIMSKTTAVKWKCMIGGAGKWKEGKLVKNFITQNNETVILKASLLTKLPDAYIVEFEWQPALLTFAEVLIQMGDIPLPPYIKRKPSEADKERYQTIYAAFEGSVAAPTAGLHFTENIFASFKPKNIETDFVTLHVGAGTFKPVKASQMQPHEMHAEWMDVNIITIKNLLHHLENCITAVGTTSLRTIESLYWMGVKALLFPESTLTELSINQWDVYEEPLLTSKFKAEEVLQGLLNWMHKNNLENLFCTTQILIAPGYQFKIAKAIITNFHQPQSTLLLLVAAAIGKDWKKNYTYALENNFRFLSYGDGSLLFIQPNIEEA